MKDRTEAKDAIGSKAHGLNSRHNSPLTKIMFYSNFYSLFILLQQQTLFLHYLVRVLIMKFSHQRYKKDFISNNYATYFVQKIFAYSLPLFIVLQGGYLSVNVDSIYIRSQRNCLCFRDIMYRVSSLTNEVIMFDQVHKTVLVYIREHTVTKGFLLKAHAQKG